MRSKYGLFYESVRLVSLVRLYGADYIDLMKIYKMKQKIKLKTKPLLNGAKLRPPTIKQSHIRVKYKTEH